MWLDLKRHFETRAIEWFNALYLTLWGSYLLLHPGVFHEDLKILFDGLTSIAPEQYWGFGAFVAGFVRLTALFINGKWGLTPLIRVATSFMSVFVWFWVCIGLSRSGLVNPSLMIYAGLVLADMYSAFRAASDAYEAEAVKRLRELSGGPDNVARIGTR